uniref:HYR domain-containing protein n=1 Tax=Pinctada fucata TaxID=50426 RepID=A0A194ALV6_PINFU
MSTGHGLERRSWSVLSSVFTRRTSCCNYTSITTRAPVTTPLPTRAPVTTPLPTRAPEFKNCPTKTTTVHVNEHNVVNLKVALQHIVATDHHGNVLSLTYSTMELRHCACSETFRNEHQIAVSTYPDDHGRIATCAMIVRVHDPHPPTFVTCPSKIQDFEDEVINWVKPTVTDNVKVYMNELRSAYRNNTRFPDGNHMVTYIASDHEGNIAVCSFRVEIWKRDSKDPAMPTTLQRQKSSGEHEHNIKDKLHIILPVLGGIVLIAMAVILYMCCRRSRSGMRNTSQYAARGHTNATYGGYEGPPPDYDNIANQKLPPYTSSEPPVYEEIQKSKLPDDAGMDNPTYADPEEVKVSVQKLSDVTKA